MREAIREMVEEMVDEQLDAEGDIKFGKITFRRSYALRMLDPMAYREAVTDTADILIADLLDELNQLDPDEDEAEVIDLKERIEALESI
jgi:uncharacterized protein YaaN involved in tellurite resistance